MQGIHDLRTPALLVDARLLEQNLRLMSSALPGRRLRPHVKAHKCTELARRQRHCGHAAFTCATLREIEGMIAAGLDEDLLLANQTLDIERLRNLEGKATVAVDSLDTITAAAEGGVENVLVEVNVGLDRCGCAVDDTARLAEAARKRGLNVRGVMGYEGHAAHVERSDRRRQLTEDAMSILKRAQLVAGVDLVSAGSTGTFDCNFIATEIQAGSYALMDTSYAKVQLPFQVAVSILATVISASGHRVVLDCGLKALGMDEGPPAVGGASVLAVHDEHTIVNAEQPRRVGQRMRVLPAHVDPTIAYHDRMHVVEGDRVLDCWPVDLRGWGRCSD